MVHGLSFKYMQSCWIQITKMSNFQHATNSPLLCKNIRSTYLMRPWLQFCSTTWEVQASSSNEEIGQFISTKFDTKDNSLRMISWWSVDTTPTTVFLLIFSFFLTFQNFFLLNNTSMHGGIPCCSRHAISFSFSFKQI